MPNKDAASSQQNGNLTWQDVHNKIVGAKLAIEAAIQAQNSAVTNAEDASRRNEHKRLRKSLSRQKEKLTDIEKQWVGLAVFSADDRRALSRITTTLTKAVARNKAIKKTLDEVNTAIGYLTGAAEFIRNATKNE